VFDHLEKHPCVHALHLGCDSRAVRVVVRRSGLSQLAVSDNTHLRMT